MEKIVKNLHDFDPMLSLNGELITRMATETGVCAKPICNIVAEEITDYVDDLLGKAALALKKCHDEIMDGDESHAIKYRGIAEGLCYAASEAAGMSFNAAYRLSLEIAKKF